MLNEDEFYNRFKSYEKDKLFEIIRTRENYQDKALRATLRLIKEKGYEEDLAILLNSLKEEENRVASEEFQNTQENFEFYSKAVQFKTENNYIDIRTSEIIKFEAALANKEVDYFSEDKNIDAFRALYPTHRYYFLSKDMESIDLILRDLEMTDPTLDYKPFFKFELKTMVLVVLLLSVIVLIISLIA